ncbi:MAG: signal peptidase I [Oscillospiraceae bacterium]|nr:signal peptidase I [Oscillospiraceae bacterium]
MKTDAAARTVNDFNREYLYNCWVEETVSAKQPRKGQAIKDSIFYACLLMMVLLAFFYSGTGQNGKQFGPFAYNSVLTTSMQSVYPQGSLITSWAIAPDEKLTAGLENGTDIVFTKSADGEVVVHRIIAIMEDYEDSGQRAFRTQGVDNPSPDQWVVYEGNVVGRVTWHIPYLGAVMEFIAQNVLWVVLILVILFTIAAMLKIVFKKEQPTPQPPS